MTGKGFATRGVVVLLLMADEQWQVLCLRRNPAWAGVLRMLGFSLISGMKFSRQYHCLCRLRHRFSGSLAVLAALLMGGAALGQVNPATYPHRDENGLGANATTLPADDAVLELAPEALNLVFPDNVRLVKLTLRDEKSAWVDINFRYNPRPRRDYVWNLPELPAAVYYTAEWAILSDREQLIRGSFSFAFGPDALAPSVIREAEELFLRERAGTDPDTLYVAPPPTRIIINQEPRPFDPPFTIDLEEDGPC